MRTLRICIGSNDGNTIAKTHMGDTDSFYIYDLVETGESLFVDQRKNLAKDMDHAQSDKMKAILAQVDDTDILIAQQLSPNFIKIAKQTKYQPVVVKAEPIQAILDLLQVEFEKICTYVERRKKGETLEVIPELMPSR
ncbi:MAG: hypothetical protein KAG12_08620 [Desulfuromusa sp.]|nr:hypothetical protein [Desulfuromusa sp.]